eukprot:TRINITY_DN1961_c1_g1_i12.p1 TRINITY_DN1961_c1_g1~~TRINITY_DN1961_c1_g1_i12.p1  ORF type:complete len:282 (-),score=24.58 TRINITY_DN1961_c1_g1_i12:287-1132(-)
MEPMSSISDWKHRFGSSKVDPPAAPVTAGRKPLLNKEETTKLFVWIQVQNGRGVPVAASDICLYAEGLLRCNPLRKENLEAFGGTVSFSQAWANQLCSKHGMTSRRPTTGKSSSLNDTQAARRFAEYVGRTIKEHGIRPELTWNMDQTALPLLPLGKKTKTKRGSKVVKVRGLGDKRAVTGQFCVSLSGGKLHPQLIYTGRTEPARCRKYPGSVPRVAHPPKGWSLTASKSHWATQETLRLWVKDLFLPFATTSSSHRAEHPPSPSYSSLMTTMSTLRRLL